MEPSLAVVGATGAVGEIMRQVLVEHRFAYRTIKFLASERSAGKPITFAGKSFTMACIQGHYTMDGRDIVRSNTSEEYKKEPRFATAGSVVSQPWRKVPSPLPRRTPMCPTVAGLL